MSATPTRSPEVEAVRPLAAQLDQFFTKSAQEAQGVVDLFNAHQEEIEQLIVDGFARVEVDAEPELLKELLAKVRAGNCFLTFLSTYDEDIGTNAIWLHLSVTNGRKSGR